MHKYPLEMLLRRPVELQSAIAYAMAGSLVALSPSLVMGAVDVPWITNSLLAGFLARGAQRAYEGCRLLKYQYELHVLPEYFIDSRDVPTSKTDLFLGMGFEWRARHTQRMVDLDRREFDYHKDRGQGLAYRLARKIAVVLKKNTHYRPVWTPIGLEALAQSCCTDSLYRRQSGLSRGWVMGR